MNNFWGDIREASSSDFISAHSLSEDPSVDTALWTAAVLLVSRVTPLSASAPAAMGVGSAVVAVLDGQTQFVVVDFVDVTTLL
jgi:hypothetical protein